MSREAWRVVGPFCEKLFIDWVDTEWCWRALANNMIIVQTPSVIISHELGYGQKILLVDLLQYIILSEIL